MTQNSWHSTPRRSVFVAKAVAFRSLGENWQ
jgi:hypothetical protein